MSLGTMDENGPWVSDVIFVHDDKFNIYWISERKTRHSQAIEKNPKVAGTITISNSKGQDNVGLQFEGIAEKVDGDIIEVARLHRKKRGKPEPEQAGKILDEGEAWYCLRPKKIELIYEPLFEFDKKVLDLA